MVEIPDPDDTCGEGDDRFVVGYVRCCRIWPVSAYAPIGRCGLCGEEPR